MTKRERAIISAAIGVAAVVSTLLISSHVRSVATEQIHRRDQMISSSIQSMAQDKLIRPDDVDDIVHTMQSLLRDRYRYNLHEADDVEAWLEVRVPYTLQVMQKTTAKTDATSLLRKLSPYLNSEEPVIRLYACAMLHDIHTPECRAALLKASTDSDAAVRSVATDGLRNIGAASPP